MRQKTVLVVEDEEDIQQLVSYNLMKGGFSIICAESGEEALERMGARRPDIIILDLMLPGINGLEVCKTIRRLETSKDIPIIMLTAKGEESDIVTGLELGADDYVTKPFSPKILLARVRAILRRKEEEKAEAAQAVEPSIHVAELTIDPAKFEVLVKGDPVQLTLSEFDILKMLARRSGWVFTRQQIIDSIRGFDYNVTPRAIDVHIFSLRKKLGKVGKKIEAVRGIGYRFKVD
ncbi:MAG: response regulator transcription factor [Thermodesulfobacteriota bacterium]